jgi:hypothetical protein
MHFTFEQIVDENEFNNLTSCTDINPSGIKRFTPSPLVTVLYKYIRRHHNLKITFGTTPLVSDEPYIIASGVAHSPDGWAEAPNGSKTTPFDHLTKQQRYDLKWGKAYLLLDQSHEGYHEHWLWGWFHDKCNKYDIPIQRIIYVTGNMNGADQYNEWATNHGLLKEVRMYVFPYSHFEIAMASMIPESNLPTAKQQFKYKRKNAASIKLYDCLQKRARNHRAWLFTKLHKEQLLDKGVNSMNEFTLQRAFMEGQHLPEEDYNSIKGMLPMYPPNENDAHTYESQDCGQFLIKYNDDIMLQTWLSIVSEAHYSDVDTNHTVFLSEKTFKPIACSQPFILYSNKGSLRRLRELGYMTFHPFIDETYDDLETFDRLDAIVKELKRIDNFTTAEKLDWLKSMVYILRYNRNHLEKLATTPSINMLTQFRKIFYV